MFGDPSGEFIVAAAIKPGANFGSIFAGALIGGVAAAVGAGVGNIVAQSLGVMSTNGAGFFGNAAIQALGFWTGAAVGAASGFTAGFIGAAGNAWANGSNFGEGLGVGFKAGVAGAVVGGLAGGISAGIKAAREGRRFFDGAKINDEILVDQSNPYIHQTKKANCVAACGQSATDGNVTQTEIRHNLALGSDGDRIGLGDGDVVKYISQKDGGTAQYFGKNMNKFQVVDNMRKGNQIFVTKFGNPNHTVLMNKVVQRTITKLSGAAFTKNLYFVMEPLKGQYTSINKGFLKNANFWIRKL